MLNIIFTRIVLTFFSRPYESTLPSKKTSVIHVTISSKVTYQRYLNLTNLKSACTDGRNNQSLVSG